mmetsp:Transcript_17806/g.25781  ORF Transcript_17806/g.25781 Transcript_17806/m.25781 type:complete len:84 (+) Transcript_17806:133-384(+)
MPLPHQALFDNLDKTMKQTETLADNASMSFSAMALVFTSATASGHFVNLVELQIHLPYVPLTHFTRHPFPPLLKKTSFFEISW